jgi:hypothetical protein
MATVPAHVVEAAAGYWYANTPGASVRFDYEDALNEAWAVSLGIIDKHDPSLMSVEGYLHSRIQWRLSNALERAARDHRNRDHAPPMRQREPDPTQTAMLREIAQAARTRLSGIARAVVAGQTSSAQAARNSGIPKRTMSRHIAKEIQQFRQWAAGEAA